ncbi:MAG: M3 family oligoendopeptidase, partial [Chitinophagaceae bacterium]|nr:M3 family oligoendopeptidase [Chitinophagaceae bacterium]
MSFTFEPIEKIKRSFLPEGYTLTDWPSLEPYLEDLKNRPLDSKEALEKWMSDVSEIEAVVGEDAAWRQIKMTLDTTDKAVEEAFTYFCMEIEPKMKPYFFELNKKLLACPFVSELDKDTYFPYLRSVKNAVELYREENVPLEAEMSVLAQQYGVISGKMTIEHDGKEYTLQQAAKFLQKPDRELREAIFRKVAERRMQDIDQLNELFNKLLALRQKVAENAGFKNYRDYKFKALGRFDYTPEDCFAFHDAVREHILPLNKMLSEHRRKRLGLDKMRPWDGSAEPVGTEPLQPFETGAELSDKSTQVFNKLRPYFSSCLHTMTDMKRLDL